MMKRLFIICLCFILLVAAFGCKAKPSTEAEKASSVFQATIIEIKDGAMLVKPVDGYPEANYAELMNVMIQHMPSSPEPKAGDVIEITYNGIVTEEDPPSPCGVETIKIVNAGSAIADESIDVPVQVSDVGSNQFEGEFIEVKPQCPPSYGVSFWLPKDWKCEGMQSEDEPTSDLVVSIMPNKTGVEGAISIGHMAGFGVCGTGLVQKDIEFNGHPAWQGFYDGNTLWSHIILKDPKDCVIINSAENWYEEYEEEINKILATVEFVYYDNNPSTSGPAEPIIDLASFDIDGDGIIENCTITYGPTSGLYTAVITASVNGNIKHKNTFNLAWGDLSFGEKDGSLYLVRDRHQEGQEPQIEYHKLSVEEGRIAIDGLDPIYEGYWGGSDWNYNLKDPSPNGNDTASDALPTAESLLTITSDGEAIQPFMHFAYSSEWTGAFFISADGTPMEENMTEWAKDTHIPLLRYSDDFSVTYAEGVKLYYIRIFDEIGKHPDNFHKAHLTDISQLADVKPGKYYVCLVVIREGAYIPEANSSESTGWDCMFRMIVE